jgi:hypothetical protein
MNAGGRLRSGAPRTERPGGSGGREDGSRYRPRTLIFDRFHDETEGAERVSVFPSCVESSIPTAERLPSERGRSRTVFTLTLPLADPDRRRWEPTLPRRNAMLRPQCAVIAVTLCAATFGCSKKVPSATLS